MNFGHVSAIAVGLFVVGLLTHLAYQAYQLGGLRSALFGARITGTPGEIEAKSPRVLTLKVRVHQLEAKDPDTVVGLEFVSKSFLSYNMFPVPLSAESALELADLLREAASKPTCT